jgi:hypothetical protein
MARGITKIRRDKRVGGRKRKEIYAKRKTVAAAKGGGTKQLRLGETGLDYRPMGSLIEGQVIKKGVLGMATRAIATNEQMSKIQKMDPRYLQGMYENNRLLFDIYFSYDNIDFHNGYYTVGDEKLEDIELLILEYERIYGTL